MGHGKDQQEAKRSASSRKKIREAAAAWIAENDYASKPMIKIWAREHGANLYKRVSRVDAPGVGSVEAATLESAEPATNSPVDDGKE